MDAAVTTVHERDSRSGVRELPTAWSRSERSADHAKGTLDARQHVLVQLGRVLGRERGRVTRGEFLVHAKENKVFAAEGNKNEVKKTRDDEDYKLKAKQPRQ